MDDVAEEACPGCGRVLKTGTAFCTSCGRPRGSSAPPPETIEDRRRKVERSWREFRFVIVLYGLLLATSGIMLIAVQLGAAPLPTLLWLSVIDTVIVVGASVRHRRLLVPSLARAGFGPVAYLGVAAVAPPGLLAVHLYVEGLTGLFGVANPAFMEEFEGVGLAGAVLLGAVWPAVVEELAFRGVMFGLLRKHLSVREAIFISSFAFAILHLSVPSLVTHLPMGIWFCWLRHRSGSLWPPMLAHFLHNTGVVAGEEFGLLPEVF